MATHIGIGFSQNMNVEIAARDAAFDAKTNLGKDKIDLAIVFSTTHYNPNISSPIIQKILNNTNIIGSSTAGIILTDSIEMRGIGILTINTDEIALGINLVEDLNSQSPKNAGAMLARNCLQNFAQQPRHAFLFFADTSLQNNSEFLKGLQEMLGNVFPVIGAGSSDDFHYEDNFQFYQDRILSNSAVGLIIGGHANVSISAQHGWRPLGKPRMITKAEGSVIKEIDGKRATAIFEEYFGEATKNVPNFQLEQTTILYPLGIQIEGSYEYLLRNAVDTTQDGGIVCQGEVPLNSEVHIMISNKESCMQAAYQAAKEAHKNLLGKKAKLVLILESMTRLKLLGRSASLERDLIKDFFGPNVPIIGMYTNGEFCPFQTVEHFVKPHFQNKSVIIMAIS